MKLISIIIVILITILSLSFKNDSLSFENRTLTICDSLPDLNKTILDFVKTKIGKKTGKGECWDLAAEALNLVKAKWNGSYEFGKEVNYKQDCIFAGDIIQFEGIVVKYTVNKQEYIEKFPHHTAIIYEVKSKDEFILAHQNTSNFGKKVGLSSINLKTISKGKFKIFRPFK